MMLSITALLQRLDGSKLSIGSEAPVFAVYLLKEGAFWSLFKYAFRGENNLETPLSSQQQAFNPSGIKPEQQI